MLSAYFTNMQFQNISDKINKTIKTVNREGLEDNTENLFYSLRNSNIQHLKSTEIKGIESAQNMYNHYDSIFIEFKDILGKYKETLIKKLNNIHDPESVAAIDKELIALKESFSVLENTKIQGEYLFKTKTEAVIGENLRAIRTFGSDFININGVKISDMLDSFISSSSPDLDLFDKIFDDVNLKHTEVGARSMILKSTKNLYENLSLNEETFMRKRYKLEESYAELNKLTLNYEALSKIYAKVSSLSLVNYV